MKKRIFIFLILILFFISGCSIKENSENENINKFKEDYESLNGKITSSGKNFRNLSIDEENPFVYITADDLLKKIENNESFYVYFGSKKCPWCRSVIEVAIYMAKENKVYYVDIWDDEGNEILRDKYSINEDGELEKIIDGTDAYYRLLELFDEYLEDYTLTDYEGKNIKVGEKRIYAPNFIYISDGRVKNLVTGIYEKQKDAYDELNDEILEDEKGIFNEFFSSHLFCSDTIC
ncbi:MAG: hypothetical protein ACI4XM_07875 [Candidatus Coprovivens sp.]